MSAGRELMRVSDAERQAAAERLRAAMAEGRLDLLEYDNRIAAAYQAATYGDLDKLFVDLPAHAVAPAATHVPPAPVALPGRAVRTGFPAVPTAVKVLWTVWAVAVLINLTVWLLVSLGNADLEYFWPMWLAVPGVALAGVTAAVTAGRSHR